jgi:hypothetical protein
VSPRLFCRVADAVTEYDDYFKEKENAAGKMGCHPYQKIAACFKLLATACTPDSLDREFRMSGSVIMESFKHFIQGVVDLFEQRYLRSPNETDIQAFLQVAEDRGFPGMLGSLDCMHWVWENCPVAWHDEHRGHTQKPTIILEAVVGPDLWFWHAFFGLPGSLNDINVLHRSPVFDDLASCNAPAFNFTVNGHHYDMGYYLADGIYPDWATLIKGVPSPVTEKQKLFTLKQSAYRKDVERAFGVLQAKFAIVKCPARMFMVADLKNIMSCCIILHNMAVADERGLPLATIDDFEDATAPVLLPRNVPSIQTLIANHRKIEDRGMHHRLQEDLMEHVWNECGSTWGKDNGLLIACFC